MFALCPAERIHARTSPRGVARADDDRRAPLGELARDLAADALRSPRDQRDHDALRLKRFDDPDHPARVAARQYRAALRERLRALAERLAPGDGDRLGDQLALLADGMYTSAAHLGPDGPAGVGAELAVALLEAARRG